MSQTQAERLQAERKKTENQFDITQYEHVPDVITAGSSSPR